eukprot:TRINITY_DN5297_c0_g1_i1.p1 TRINITY_DN5297_c0_g1~~TRINITY_DN5297_c0_g1_i1.p1  ORF type:complete len:133 (+),score=16.59 TRINITY_DN5297_c0_g1_i1:38-436(+)
MNNSNLRPEDIIPPKMKVSLEELELNQIPLGLRDYCSHLLIPLKDCRQDHFFFPWKCGHERHMYEVCQYKEYLRRTYKTQLYLEQNERDEISRNGALKNRHIQSASKSEFDINESLQDMRDTLRGYNIKEDK